MSSPSANSPKRVKPEVDHSEVKREDEDYHSAISAEEISDDPVPPKKEKAKVEASGSITATVTANARASKKRAAPKTYEDFEKSEGVTFHLVIKNAKGDEIRSVRLKKHQFNSGSYGWELSGEKAIIDDGDGDSMSVSLSSSCVVQGSKKAKSK